MAIKRGKVNRMGDPITVTLTILAITLGVLLLSFVGLVFYIIKKEGEIK